MKKAVGRPQVAIIMGSDSDLAVMGDAAEILESFGIGVELTVVSAHRTPDRLFQYSKKAHTRGIRVIIAGAGGAAHLPGMAAALSPLPVIGVPIKSSNSVGGVDSLLSIVQMPAGVPVATVAINGAKNAGILAAQIIGSANAAILKKMIVYKSKLNKEVLVKVKKLQNSGYKNYGKKKA